MLPRLERRGSTVRNKNNRTAVPISSKAQLLPLPHSKPDVFLTEETEILEWFSDLFRSLWKGDGPKSDLSWTVLHVQTRTSKGSHGIGSQERLENGWGGG